MKADFLPGELEYLSETKARRIEEGTLYFIDDIMKRIIHVRVRSE